MRVAAYIFSAFILAIGCRPAKKVQRIENAMIQTDTTISVVTTPDQPLSDTLENARNVYSKMVSKKIQFKTFSAKVRVGYEMPDGGDEATAYIRMEKDSLIWLSLRGALGIEGFRVLITPDSVKVMNLLKKTVQLRSIAFLQEVSKLPFDFRTLQEIIVGNPVFIEGPVVSYMLNANNETQLLLAGRYFKHLLNLDADTRLTHSKLDDVDPTRSRTCDITFSNYENVSGVEFSTLRKISVAEKSKLDIELDFKQYDFNQPQTFPFTISKSFKIQ